MSEKEQWKNENIVEISDNQLPTYSESDLPTPKLSPSSSTSSFNKYQEKTKLIDHKGLVYSDNPPSFQQSVSLVCLHVGNFLSRPLFKKVLVLVVSLLLFVHMVLFGLHAGIFGFQGPKEEVSLSDEMASENIAASRAKSLLAIREYRNERLSREGGVVRGFNLQSYQQIVRPVRPSETVAKRNPDLYAKLMNETVFESNPSAPRVAFINRHHGCHEDFDYLAYHFNFQYIEVNFKELFKHTDGQREVEGWLTEKEADHETFRDMANIFCEQFDIVFVADVNTDSRFLLQRIDHQPHTCGIEKVVMLTTNRFNYYANLIPEEGEDTHIFCDLLVRVSSRTIGPRIVWVANNPWEPPYAAIKLGGWYLNYTVIRPFGVSTLPSDKVIPAEEASQAVILEEGFTRGFHKVLKENDIPIRPITKSYGGPQVLRQYKAYVEFPYQVSTMKMYENLANGVVCVIPTARFFQELVKLAYPPESDNVQDVWFWGLYLMNFQPQYLGPDWIKYMDYYNEDLKDFFYTFDSLDELRYILSRRIFDVRNLRKKQVIMYKALRQKSLRQWAEVLKLELIKSLVTEDGRLVSGHPGDYMGSIPAQEVTMSLSGGKTAKY